MRDPFKDLVLDEFEQEIEDTIHLMVPVTGEKKERLDKIREAAREKRKNKSINIRISEYDLKQIKSRAADEGMPYQTLITSVLHKYLNGRLLDADSAEAVAELLK